MFSVAIVMLPFFALAQAQFSTPRSLAVAGTPINHNGDVTKCLGVFNADIKDRTYIQIQDCNGSGAQSWTISRGNTTVQLTGTNFCLDASPSPTTGIAMKIRECSNNNPAQAWTYTDNNTIQLAEQQQCVDLSNGDETNGNLIQSWACASGNTNQVWTVPTTGRSTAINPNGNTGKCLDVRASVFAPGTPVEIFDCNGTGAQNWTISRGTTNVQLTGTNLCMDASASPADNVSMILQECNGNLIIPSWTYTSNNKFVAAGQSWCLDLSNGITMNFNRVQTWGCATTPNQVWTTSLN